MDVKVFFNKVKQNGKNGCSSRNSEGIWDEFEGNLLGKCDLRTFGKWPAHDDDLYDQV